MNKYVFGTSSNFDYYQGNSCCFLLFEVKFTTFWRHWKVVSLDFFNMLIIKINCVLYSGLVTKQNQISQNIYTTAHCPITPPTKTNHHWFNQM